MTNLGIAYYNAQLKDRELTESERANRVQEQETERYHNLSTAETKRANTASESIRQRQNEIAAYEAETSRQKLQPLQLEANAAWQNALNNMGGLEVKQKESDIKQQEANIKEGELAVALQNAASTAKSAAAAERTSKAAEVTANSNAGSNWGRVAATIGAAAIGVAAGKHAAKVAQFTDTATRTKALEKELFKSSATGTVITMAAVENYLRNTPSGSSLLAISGLFPDNRVVPEQDIPYMKRWYESVEKYTKDWSAKDWRQYLTDLALKKPKSWKDVPPISTLTKSGMYMN